MAVPFDARTGGVEDISILLARGSELCRNRVPVNITPDPVDGKRKTEISKRYIIDNSESASWRTKCFDKIVNL